MQGKFDESDKTTILEKVEETIKWLDANQEKEKEEYEAKQKELEGICNPIMQKMYSAAGGAPGPPATHCTEKYQTALQYTTMQKNTKTLLKSVKSSNITKTPLNPLKSR